MKNPQVDLDALLAVIGEEARTNPVFAAKLEQAASGIRLRKTRSIGSAGQARRRNRRASAVLDPFVLFKSSEAQLRDALHPLTLDQLRDIVSEHGMDGAKLALKWKDPERLQNLIVDTVRSRSRKGDAFRSEESATEPPKAPRVDYGPKPEIKTEVKVAVRKLDEGTMWFDQRVAYLKTLGKAPAIPKEAGWREVAVMVKGSISPFPAQGFLDHLFAHQPRVSGWPIWMDSRLFPDSDQHPYPNPPAWEALIRNDRVPGRFISDLLDFWRIEPVCSFYHRRLFYEDVMAGLGDKRAHVLDFNMSISMVTEAISVATAFAGALSANPRATHIEVAFRWNRLRGRELGTFLDPARDLLGPRPAYQDEAVSVIEVELANQRTTLARFVGMAVRPLFDVFGYTASQSVIDDIVGKIGKRELG